MLFIPQNPTGCDRCEYLLQQIEQILMRQLSPRGVMPLVPEKHRTYPNRHRTPTTDGPENGWYWGVTDDDYYRK